MHITIGQLRLRYRQRARADAQRIETLGEVPRWYRDRRSARGGLDWRTASAASYHDRAVEAA